jgi:hypothetical protein
MLHTALLKQIDDRASHAEGDRHGNPASDAPQLTVTSDADRQARRVYFVLASAVMDPVVAGQKEIALEVLDHLALADAVLFPHDTNQQAGERTHFQSAVEELKEVVRHEKPGCLRTIRDFFVDSFHRGLLHRVISSGALSLVSYHGIQTYLAALCAAEADARIETLDPRVIRHMQDQQSYVMTDDQFQAIPDHHAFVYFTEPVAFTKTLRIVAVQYSITHSTAAPALCFRVVLASGDDITLDGGARASEDSWRFPNFSVKQQVYAVDAIRLTGITQLYYEIAQQEQAMFQRDHTEGSEQPQLDILLLSACVLTILNQNEQ